MGTISRRDSNLPAVRDVEVLVWLLGLHVQLHVLQSSPFIRRMSSFDWWYGTKACERETYLRKRVDWQLLAIEVDRHAWVAAGDIVHTLGHQGHNVGIEVGHAKAVLMHVHINECVRVCVRERATRTASPYDTHSLTHTHPLTQQSRTERGRDRTERSCTPRLPWPWRWWAWWCCPCCWSKFA